MFILLNSDLSVCLFEIYSLLCLKSQSLTAAIL